eukprot:788764-Amorphochlora_amoeboformis.AAC.1
MPGNPGNPRGLLKNISRTQPSPPFERSSGKLHNMSSALEKFTSEMIGKGKNMREIIALGLRKKYRANDIMAAIQRQTAVRSMGKNEIIMEEEELSSDEDEVETSIPMVEEDLTQSETKMQIVVAEGKSGEQGPKEEDWDDAEGGDWDDAGDGWDDGNDAFVDASELAAPILTRAASFKVHKSSEIQLKQEGLMSKVSELLYVTRDEAGCLLRHFRWDDGKLKQEWFEDQKKVRIKVGLSRPRSDGDSSSDGKVQCLSWGCNRVPIRKAHALNCGHYFCKRCWRKFLESEVCKGRTCIFARCPAMRCKKQHIHKFGCTCPELVPSSVFKKYLKYKPELFKKYETWNLQSFVEGQEGLKWCPNPKCTRVVEYKLGGEKTVECQCEIRFCFSCMREEHEPAPCDLVSKWLASTAVSDNATDLWLKARTKTCPRCNVRIEKNRACNHMHCVKCGHHFCWLCKGTKQTHS